jgi:hypothetical protein
MTTALRNIIGIYDINDNDSYSKQIAKKISELILRSSDFTRSVLFMDGRLATCITFFYDTECKTLRLLHYKDGQKPNAWFSNVLTAISFSINSNINDDWELNSGHTYYIFNCPEQQTRDGSNIEVINFLDELYSDKFTTERFKSFEPLDNLLNVNNTAHRLFDFVLQSR